MFDMMMNFVVLYNTIVITLTIFFDVRPDADSTQAIIDEYVVEGLFLLDIILNFLMEFKDPETQQPVREITAIMRNYGLKGSFFFDFLAWIPLSKFFSEQGNNGGNNLNKFLRIFRFTRIAKLLDIQRVNHMLKSFFENDSS